MFRPLSSIVFRCAIGLAGFLLTACGGSQQSLPSPASAPIETNKNSAFSQVRLIIKIPPRATLSNSGRRRPLFVSPSIVSVKVTVTALGSAPATVTSNVVCSTAVPPACTVTATILAPVNSNDTFAVTAYDGANATGNILSQGSLVYPISAGRAAQIPVVLQGAVASIVAVNVANANPQTGTSATSSVSVTAADADGNVIAGQYQTPVTLDLLENDPDASFSFVAGYRGAGAFPTATVAGSATRVTVYLKAKTDSTTPDDATIVATVSNAPFVPGTSPDPPLSSVAEVTTSCPTTSHVCVYYPSGYDLLASTPAGNSPNQSAATINYWNDTSVFPGAAQDSVGAGSIWNVPLALYGVPVINRFDTATGTFSTVASAAPLSDATTDIGGEFLGLLNGPNEALTFTPSGTTINTYPVSTAGSAQAGTIAVVGSSIDSLGQFWALDQYMFAINAARDVTIPCAFEVTDVNFASPQITALEVAGANIWIGVSGAADGFTYAFKVPAPITSSGCDLTTLERPATQFRLTTQAGAEDVNQFALDSAGDVYVEQASAVTKIGPGGQVVKLVDTGLTFVQAFGAGFAIDPSGTELYLVDTGSGTLDRASVTTPSTNPLQSTALPPVFGLGTNPIGYSGAYQPFFTPDGALWLGAAAFMNPNQLFSFLGLNNTVGVPVAGGLARITLGGVAFAARAIGEPKTPDQIRRILRSHRALHGGFKRAGNVGA